MAAKFYTCKNVWICSHTDTVVMNTKIQETKIKITFKKRTTFI